MNVLRRSWPWAFLMTAFLALGAAACGGGEEKETPTPAATTPGAVATATPAATVKPGPGVTDTEIKLGHSNDLAGTGGTPYGVITPAVKAYFEKVNKEDGGVCGRQINLLAEDDQYTPAVALEKAKKLVEQDQVFAIVGALGTGAHLAVVDYLNDPNGDGDTKDGVPDLFVSTGFSGWGDYKKWPWTIGYIPDYVSEAKVLAKYINDTFPGKKIGILYQNDAFGKDHLNGLKAALADPTLIVSEQSYEASATDISAQVLNIKDSGADIVYLASTPGFSVKFIVGAHTQGYNPQIVMSYVNAHTSVASLIGGGTQPDQLAKGFKELEGTISTNYLIPATEATNPAIQTHKAIMEKYGGPPVSTLTVYGQSQAETVVEALKKACNKLDRKGLLEAAESIKGFAPSVALPGIKVDLGPNDHYAFQTLQVVQVQADGTLKNLGSPISVQ